MNLSKFHFKSVLDTSISLCSIPKRGETFAQEDIFEEKDTFAQADNLAQCLICTSITFALHHYSKDTFVQIELKKKFSKLYFVFYSLLSLLTLILTYPWLVVFFCYFLYDFLVFFCLINFVR